MTTTTMSHKLEQQFRTAASAASRQVLIDNMLAESQGLTKMRVILEEGKSAGGPLIVEGKVGHAGVPTANKRLYEAKIMQREIDRLQERINQGAALAAVDHPGDGKCLGKGTPVLLADGRVLPVEQVAVGDRLMGPDGEARVVLSTTSGRALLYRVDPLKGESFICNGPHILSLVHTSTGEVIDIAVEDYINKGVYFKSRYKQFSVGVESFENAPEAPTVDPYFVGAWFGDGSKSNTESVTEGERLRCVALTNLDPEIIAYCEDIASKWELHVNKVSKKTTEASTYYISGERGQDNRLLRAMRDLVGAEQKVPDSVLRGSRETRLQFLAGFLDTDGELNHNCFYINQKRQDWADAVYFVAKSLGFGATRGQRVARDQNGAEGIYHTVTIFGHVDQIPTRVAYKKADPRGRITDATRTGFSVTALGEGDYYGFEIDGDGRFLLGDFTVTHNSRIREAGAICRGLRMEADGTIIGRYEIVEDSNGGHDLAAFLRRGAAIGMSSRGLGSTTVDANGCHVVGEDFRLHGFDFVADPACRDAYPTLVSESVDVTNVTEDQLRAQFPQLIESIETRARQVGAEVVEAEAKEGLRNALSTEIREQLREDFAAKLVKALQQQRSQVEEVVRSELLSDPSVAGAKKFMEDLANKLVPYRPTPDSKALIDARDAEIEGLKARLQNMEEAINEVAEQKKGIESQARSLGFRLFVERALSGQVRADQMRSLIGDPAQYDTVEDLQSKVKAVIEQVNAAHVEAENRARAAVKVKEHKAELATAKAQMVSEELDRVRDEFTAKIESVSERFQRQLAERDSLLDQAASHIDRLTQELAKAQSLAEQAEAIAYAERRAVGHPRRDDLIAAVKSGRAATKDQIRQLAESWEVRGEEVGGAAERVRRSLGKGREAPTEADSHRIAQLHEDREPVPGLEGFGTTMGELKQLAGIGQSNTRRRF